MSRHQRHARGTARGPSLSRRGFVGAAAAATGLIAGGSARAAGGEAPITIAINQSPWFEGFRRTVDAYQKETGNRIPLEVYPFAATAEKQRGSVRASQGLCDLLPMNARTIAEMYFGGFLTPIHEIDPDFKLDPGIYTFDDSIYFDAAKKTMNAIADQVETLMQQNGFKTGKLDAL